MQIRLSLLARRGAGRDCDVLVTAPAGTQLSAVAAGLKQAARAGETTSSWWVDGARLDPHRAVLGEPPLVDGAVLSLGGPAGPAGEPDPAAPQLQVVSGPDAGGVHVLHGGEVRIGRSADADVTLDDPDVSRAHCAVVLGPGGRAEVADLGSTNGTSIEGRPVGRTPQPLPRGALLRVGESVLRVVAGGTQPPVATVPDGEGHVRVRAGAAEGSGAGAGVPRTRTPEVPRTSEGPHAASPYGTDATHAAQDLRGLHEAREREADGAGREREAGEAAREGRDARPHPLDGVPEMEAPAPQDPGESRTARRKGGLGRWGRRRGARTDEAPAATAGAGRPAAAGPATTTGLDGTAPDVPLPPAPAPLPAHSADAWPDPALLLLTALGPGPRLWERGPGHPEALACRVGTGEHPRPEGGALPVPLTVSLAESGSLGLAGPRERLSGLARAVLAQYAALHSPDTLEIVLISTDRHQPLTDRVARWGWLGWLPHVRPTRGQECRALLAYDNEQAAARFAEIRGRAPGQYEGLRTLVVLDGDPGTPALREAAAWCAGAEGRAAGVHLVCLAETDAASSPVAETFEEACGRLAAFRDCGAVALLSGDVATAVHVARTAHGRLAGQGTTGTVDAVSAAWAERFARALAPLRTDAAQGAPRTAATASPLPQAVRLLDELGLARATPASLLARWASAAEEAPGGRVLGVLGAGPEGPAHVDLGGARGPHLIIEGPAGSGRTELLRALAASLAAGERPDRLGLVLVDGAGAPPEGAGLGVCADLPHVTTVLRAQDPVRMREFAQALAAELKRRARLLDGGEATSGGGDPLVPAQGGVGDTPSGRVRARGTAGPGTAGPGTGPAGGEGPAGGGTGAGPGGPRAAAVSVAARTSRIREQEVREQVMFDQEQPPYGPTYERERSRYGQERAAHGPYGRPRVPYDQEADQRPAPHPADATAANSADHPGASLPAQSRGAETGDIEAPPSRTLRLRPRTSSAGRSPLPRLVVLVDDVDALLDPPLGATGRPAAGSVVRALEAVVRDGARLGVHLIAAGARTEKAAASYVARAAGVRVVLDAPSPAPEDPAPGRGRLLTQDGAALPFQGGRVTARIPRTATLRPTVTPLEWPKMGDAPERARPVRELGNGPTDLALLASALDRAARAAEAKPLEPLL
ncbi:FHA domain-containing protein [Streptomyces sp. NPDC047046]|uniref:FHA domain-containing protein n=1 Tax=Streptomyces sp. NPDC047046 TaxID=3155378 RepID=UPI0033E3F8F3